MSGYLDSRDLSAEMEELRERLDAWGRWESNDRESVLVTADGRALPADDADNPSADPLDVYEFERLGAIEAIEGCCEDWEYGATLIPEDEFEDYAREFAQDIGAIEDDARWPCDCIDWERAASELAMDYTTVGLGDTTYYVR